MQLFIECGSIKDEEYYIAAHSHIIPSYNLITDINIATKLAKVWKPKVV